ncbi:DUF3566 domain-containing protein [Nocardioides sp. CER19]|uniref:DUF3566 domain-containing protein n=1 Tax=Nocardioides sp. CER19 TaxID=3038538 RepID=UPI00244C6F11|nr:DUF3566 domain-containing protein [Nocardioides sp. CER19]MDH2412787.1 DUF3566 domain-containing protein [Nocardioides sp. CER19]
MPERPGERTATRVGGRPAQQRDDDTAVRPGFAQQVKDRLSAAADEFRAANTGSTPPQRSRQGARPPRRARLRLTRIDPWSVMKTSFLLSIALGVVTIVSVFIVWSVLGAAGVWDSINQTVQDIVGGQDAGSFDVTDYVGMSRVMGFTMIVAVIDVVLMTAVATLGAFLYNMAAALLGGIDVTLTEDR